MVIFWELTEIMMALLGGSLIALASIGNLYLLGRITGLSGMVFTVARFKLSEGAVWKYSFLTGMVSACYAAYLFIGEFITVNDYHYYIFDPNEVSTADLSVVGWSFGALLVGVGTKLGNGCTSGHGVCGLPRLSIRSLVAVVLFMSSGVGMATLLHSYPFLDHPILFSSTYYDWFRLLASWAVGIALAGFVGLTIWKSPKRTDPVLSFALGLVFGIGLCLSGMCRRSKIVNFLTIKDGWDPSLLFVMGAAVTINLPAFNWILRRTECPLLASAYSVPSKTQIDLPVVVGPILFGLGWGLCGFCPGPGLVNVFIVDHGILFLVFLITGQLATAALTPSAEVKQEFK